MDEFDAILDLLKDEKEFFYYDCALLCRERVAVDVVVLLTKKRVIEESMHFSREISINLRRRQWQADAVPFGRNG